MLMKEKFEIVDKYFMVMTINLILTETNIKLYCLEHELYISISRIKRSLFKKGCYLKLLLCPLSFEADVIKDEVAFFQAVKSRINKFSPFGGKSDFEIDSYQANSR